MARKSLELFAGAGGLALGAERAGFSPIALVEIDKDAAATLRTNRPQWNVLNEDIAALSSLDLLDTFQLEDARGTLFYHYALFLKQLKPKTFLFENVRGLLTHDKGRTYRTILNVFAECGYEIKKQVLNAWDYGVAQKRERLITIGVRRDLLPRLSVSFPKKHAHKPVLREVLQGVPPSIGMQYSEDKKTLFELVPPGGYWRDIPENLAKAYMKSCWNMGGGRTGILRRLSYDEPSLTVLTSPSQKQTERCHPAEARPMNVRENARIQSFPDDWTFCGTVSSQYKQVGNAVPVNLAYEITHEIAKGLEALHERTSLYYKTEPYAPCAGNDSPLWRGADSL